MTTTRKGRISAAVAARRLHPLVIVHAARFRVRSKPHTPIFYTRSGALDLGYRRESKRSRGRIKTVNSDYIVLRRRS